MKRIGIDCRLWNETGVGRYIRNLVEQLQVLDQKNEYVLFMRSEDRKQLTINNSQLTTKENLKIVPTDIRWHSVEEQVKFPQILNKENLDLMHFPYFSVPIFYNRPYIVTIHDLIVHHFSTGKASTLPAPVYALKHLAYKYVSSQAVKKAEKIIVPLKTIKEDLISTLAVPAAKIVVTHEGVDSKLELRVERGELRNKKYFLYVGNAYPHKNLDRLVEAFIEFRKEVKDKIELILVGKDDYFYKKLHVTVENENIQGISFKHDVSDAELSELYSHAVALISPSLMEGFGLPPLEAMSLSTPVLLSDTPSFREVCADAAFYFDPYSIKSMKEQMKFVYNIGQQKRDEHIRKGRGRVKDFSWERMSKQTLAVYESCISI